MGSVLRVLAGILIGIPVLILLAWVVAQVGQGSLAALGLLLVVSLLLWALGSWIFGTLRGVGRWARRQ
jgi:hypothetical protein